MLRSILKYLLGFALVFAWLVIMLGAFTRLTESGLGCPDWPGCYAKLIVPAQEQIGQNFSGQFIETTKAWTEMIHRYAVAILSVCILLIFACCFLNYLRWKSQRQENLHTNSYSRHNYKFFQPSPMALLNLAIFLLLLLFFQAALGKWTVTWKLLPTVVSAHLLGGLAILITLWCMNIKFYGWFRKFFSYQFPPYLAWLVNLGIFILFGQIMLGAWVSSNYAALVCPDFPTCNQQWWPAADFSHAFNFLMNIGENYQGGNLELAARIAIHLCHRIGAVLLVLWTLVTTVIIFRDPKSRQLRLFMLSILFLVGIQFSLGVLNVVWRLPLNIAVAHNGNAALLLLTLVAFRISIGTRRRKYHYEFDPQLLPIN